jgi:hypothetical protein
MINFHTVVHIIVITPDWIFHYHYSVENTTRVNISNTHVNISDTHVNISDTHVNISDTHVNISPLVLIYPTLVKITSNKYCKLCTTKIPKSNLVFFKVFSKFVLMFLTNFKMFKH